MPTINLCGITCEATECITCGIPFTVPLSVWEQQKLGGGYHYCPNGHQQGWSADRSQETKDRRELERLRQQQARYEDELRAVRESRAVVERQLAATKGQVTKLKKRASAGVCPCCTRSFEDLRRHMSTKHPQFLAEDTSNVVTLKTA